MVFQLVGHPLSTCTRRVAVVLKEKKVDFEFVPVDFAKGEHKSAEFVKKQPFGQVPYIVDDGFVLFESRAIARYIATKYRDQGTPSLVPDPSDLQATALFEQAASIETSNFDFYAYAIAIEKVFKPMRGFATNEDVIKEKLATLEGKLDAYEAILGKQKYLAGDNITLADLFHLPYGATLVSAGFDIFNAKRPNVARWWEDISTRESWEAVKAGVKV
ncbi:glutathione S-transferase-like protein [Cytidiella melzeri]|nr:glutathione S-transferase-like protein [Cytidiella melzeri]